MTADNTIGSHSAESGTMQNLPHNTSQKFPREATLIRRDGQESVLVQWIGDTFILSVEMSSV